MSDEDDAPTAPEPPAEQVPKFPRISKSGIQVNLDGLTVSGPNRATQAALGAGAFRLKGWKPDTSSLLGGDALRDLVKSIDTFDKTEQFAKSVLAASGVANIADQLSVTVASQSVAVKLSEQLSAMVASHVGALRLSEPFSGLTIFEGTSDLAKFGAQLAKQSSILSGIDRIDFNAQAAKSIAMRLDGLQLGFAKQIGGAAPFGRLDAAMRSVPTLGSAIDGAVRATQRPGPLGFDYSGLYSALTHVDDVLADPEVEAVLADPINEVQQTAGLGEGDLIRLPDVLGLVRRARAVRLSTLGLFCGFTVGSLCWVFSVSAGSSWPAATIEAFIVGGEVYDRTRLKPED